MLFSFFFIVLGETNEAFYSNIYTGQALPRPMRPPRPPPPRSITTTTTTTAAVTNNAINMLNGPLSSSNSSNHSISSSNNNNSNRSNDNDEDDTNTNLDGGGQPWFCNMCTFQNHPLLNKCEQCDMPLLTTSGTVLPNMLQFHPPNTAIRNQPPIQSLTQPLPTRLYQHIPYQQQSAPPISHNPFQYNGPNNNNNVVTSGTAAIIQQTPSPAPSSIQPSSIGLNDFLPRLTQQH